jgi:hypothetical protein
VKSLRGGQGRISVIDDNSLTLAHAIALNGSTSIAPSESVICIVTASPATAAAALRTLIDTVGGRAEPGHAHRPAASEPTSLERVAPCGRPRCFGRGDVLLAAQPGTVPARDRRVGRTWHSSRSARGVVRSPARGRRARKSAAPCLCSVQGVPGRRYPAPIDKPLRRRPRGCDGSARRSPHPPAVVGRKDSAGPKSGTHDAIQVARRGRGRNQLHVVRCRPSADRGWAATGQAVTPTAEELTDNGFSLAWWLTPPRRLSQCPRIDPCHTLPASMDLVQTLLQALVVALISALAVMFAARRTAGAAERGAERGARAAIEAALLTVAATRDAAAVSPSAVIDRDEREDRRLRVRPFLHKVAGREQMYREALQFLDAEPWNYDLILQFMGRLDELLPLDNRDRYLVMTDPELDTAIAAYWDADLHARSQFGAVLAHRYVEDVYALVPTPGPLLEQHRRSRVDELKADFAQAIDRLHATVVALHDAGETHIRLAEQGYSGAADTLSEARH